MPSLVTDTRVQECTNIREATFYGQHQEDRLLLSEFFCNVRNGKYLEIGAYDGLTYSNTKYLEDVMGWSGLLIEGQPETAELLKANRGQSANVIIDKAVCKEKGKMKFTSKPTPTAGNPDHMSDTFKDRWHQDVEDQVIEVPCSPLSDMLADAKVSKLDLFVLDVEGGEFEVIKTMDWSVEVCVWLVEMDGTNPEKDQKVADILVENNYVRSDSRLFWQDDQSESYNGGGQNVAFTATDLQACLAK
jgi:FkbM family methyltransferase